jgi:hypothetical protein
MEQVHGGSIMAVLLNNGFTPEWTKRTLANLIGQGKNKPLAPRPFVAASTVFANQRPHLSRPERHAPAESERELPSPPTQHLPPVQLPPLFVAKVDSVEVPTATRVKAIDYQRRQQLMVSNVNLQQPKGCHLMAFAILPLDLFQGELGKFLMIACDFFAHGASNTMLLPAHMEGSEYFALPKHPFTTGSASLAEAVAKVKGLRQRVLVEHQRASNAMQSGDLSRMFARSDRQAEYRLELATITRGLAVSLFGTAAWETHEMRFRTTLNQM